jgi:YHS domain-containing protein
VNSNAEGSWLVRILKSLFVVLSVMLSFACPAHADQISNYVKDGVAIAGADPVAYFTQDTSVIGKPEFSADWNGVTWRFASAENRDAFKADPAKYAPQFGGYCATGTSFGKKVPIDPTQFKIVDGKLYLNSSPGAQSVFLKDTPTVISRAASAWPKIETVPADKL